jgi:hypothetical protein
MARERKPPPLARRGFELLPVEQRGAALLELFAFFDPFRVGVLQFAFEDRRVFARR